MNNIPINGRVAIVDDVIEQALPLMKVLAQNQVPYVFYKGNDLEYLPEDDQRYNDIRVLFLDINLIDDSAKPSLKQIKSVLHQVLKRIVSPENFPYSLIFWSRHQDEKDHSSIVNDLFNDELADRKPISINSFVKSDFFPNFSEELVETDTDILVELQNIINSQPAYSHILNWENQVHLAADKTLQDIFSAYHSFTDWENNANYILNKLGNAYLGKHFQDSTSEDKIKSSLVTLNTVFRDSLEHKISGINLMPNDLEYDKNNVNQSLQAINEKLNISRNSTSISEPGIVAVLQEDEENKPLFGDLLNKVIPFCRFKRKKEDVCPDIINSVLNKEYKQLKKEIKSKWLKVGLVVTPACDFAQKKNYFDRIVNGILIPKEYENYIETNEAVYPLPISIMENEEEYLLILDFRYFETCKLTNENVDMILFRVRQELLAEIQSKLARHINRQGILSLDDR